MRILIAEDEVEIAKALQVVLEHNRYKVDTVHTGIDALAYADQQNYDLIVLDIMMPGLDGIS
ncbi:MAG: response regulator transcription factor, partial [Clostridiaceae bacterium]|nr:response regulator transcription factor [Clostridiaceae bacterium]